MLSCGFHLRGNQDLSGVLTEVKVQGTSKHSELGRKLIRALTEAKVNVLDESDTVLTITRDSYTKRVLSLGSTGHANQYELRYDLGVTLVKVVQDKKLNNVIQPRLINLIPAQNISVTREYLFDEKFILATEGEERRLKDEMLRDAVLQLMRRLKFSLSSKNDLNVQKTTLPALKNK